MERQPHVPGSTGIVGGQLYAVSADDRAMGLLAHALGLCSFVGPLVLYLLRRDRSAFVRDQAAEALNFQLTLLVAYAVCGALVLVVVGLLLLPAVAVVHLVYGAVGATRAHQGIAYRYPVNVRLVS